MDDKRKENHRFPCRRRADMETDEEMEQRVMEAQREETVKRRERQKRNWETAREIAQLLAEGQAKYNDIDEIFRLSKNFLTVSFREADNPMDGNLRRLEKLKKDLAINRENIPEHELRTTYRRAYEKIQREIEELEKSIGEG